MPRILVEFPPSNGGSLLLVGTTVVGSGGVDLSLWAGDDFEMLVLSVINAVKTWRFSVSSVSFSSVFMWFFIRLLLVGVFGDKELFIRLGIHIVTPFGNFEA